MKKLYYSIGEVSQMTGLEAHVLRFWETEFPMLRPKKGRGGARLYREADLALVQEIRQLLHEERYTIEGALKKLENHTESSSDSDAESEAEVEHGQNPKAEFDEEESDREHNNTDKALIFELPAQDAATKDPEAARRYMELLEEKAELKEQVTQLKDELAQVKRTLREILDFLG